LGAASGLLGIAAVAAWALAVTDRHLEPRPSAKRPALALVTSLPLIFGESFGLEGGGSPALTRLEQRYKVQPIGVADAASLEGHKLLLMAHPRAQPAEVLIELDQWVRGGGRLLLLADPRLDWPSERPLGDRLRPPPAFADTGLLAHWGLMLSGPSPDNSVGRLTASGGCKLEREGIVARCRIGRGTATVLADADFLNVDEPGADNLDLLIEELDRLESR
jgi:hypothetical protein